MKIIEIIFRVKQFFCSHIYPSDLLSDLSMPENTTIHIDEIEECNKCLKQKKNIYLVKTW